MMKLKTIYNKLFEESVTGIFYHGTKRVKREQILSTGKITIGRRPGVYITKDRDIALHYGSSNPENVITIKVSNLNIYYFPKESPVPKFFFDVKPEDILPYKEKGFDGFGISNNTEVFVFNVEKLKVVI